MWSFHSGAAEDSDLLGCDSVSLDAWPRRFERPKCLRLKTKSPAVKSAHCNRATRRFSQRYDMDRVFALGRRRQTVTGQCFDVSVFLFIFTLSRYRQGWLGAQWRKPCFAHYGLHQSKKSPLRNSEVCHPRCVFKLYDETSTSPRGLGILYKTLLARNLSKPEDGRYRPKHVVFFLLLITTSLSHIYLQLCFDWIYLTIYVIYMPRCRQFLYSGVQYLFIPDAK